MANVETLETLNYLSELYVQDAPDAWLLAEYPSSNSPETRFKNESKFIIHDPFPPPRRELIKYLGPHHLMCAWGQHVNVTSEVRPTQTLTDHWQRVLGKNSCPNWEPFNNSADYITLFPHESLPAAQQVVDPVTNYAIHSKEVIANIDCPQADVLDSVIPPCIVKLSHGYAGLGNYLIESTDDEIAMKAELANHWPTATLVVNSIVENVTNDFGVQFYLRRDGSMVWLGFTEQMFNSNKRWCGGTFSADQQLEMFDGLCTMIEPAGRYLHAQGYFGLVGIDILRNADGDFFLVDVNPRLTGITPFLMASRIFARDDGLKEGIYQARRRFTGTLENLTGIAEKISDAKVVVLSAFEDAEASGETTTICHISVSSKSQDRNQQILAELELG